MSDYTLVVSYALLALVASFLCSILEAVLLSTTQGHIRAMYDANEKIKNNNSVPEEQAEEYAQKILNRLIFIRSCGDRQIEERHLKSMLGDCNDNKNKKLIEHLQEIFAYFRGR